MTSLNIFSSLLGKRASFPEHHSPPFESSNESHFPDVIAQLRDHQIALDEASIVSETDLKGRITYANDKFIQVSKYSREELIGRPHNIINSGLHPKEFFKDFWCTIQSGNIWRGTIRNKAKDGTFYWVSTVVVPFRNSAGKIYKYVAVRHEITKERELHEQLEQQIKIAETAVVAASQRSRFISEMSHEIRNALNNIMGNSELLSYSHLEGKQAEYVERIRKSSNYILGLMNDVLDASRLTASKVELDVSPFNLRECLSSLIDMVAGSARNKKLLLESEISGSLPEILFGDQYRLSQILLNFLNNSIKYTDSGKVVLRVELLQRDTMQERAELLFSVSDTGKGIPEEKMGSLFVDFYQCRPADVAHGTGLGLAICKKLSDLMGGEIKVHSKLGHGTTITFQIWMSLRS